MVIRASARALALSLMLAAGSLAIAQVTAVSSQIVLSAMADADNASPGEEIGVYNFSQGGTLNTLAGTADPTSWSGSEFAKSFSYGKASWVDASEGSFFTQAGFANSPIATPASFALNTAVLPTPVWRYTFDLAGPAIFTMDYRVFTTEGDGFGLHNWRLFVDSTEYELGPDWMYPDGSGTVDHVLAGGTHTVALYNYGNLHFLSGQMFSYSTAMEGHFDWRITPVPEPATMSVLALGALGLMRRRRK